MNAPSIDFQNMIEHPDAYWRSMRFFVLYRGMIASILFASYFFTQQRIWGEDYNQPLYLNAASGYLGFSLLTALLAVTRWPRFNRQLTLQAIGDISFIVVLMYSAGGVRSGLGVLLVVAIAGAAVISQGRLALFYAALASISLLLVQSWQLLTNDSSASDYSHAVMLGLSCFATAWLAHSFAKRTRQSEELASQRGIDLENLAQVNQLIIQDMQDGVIVVDRELQLRHFNSQAEALLGTHFPPGLPHALAECSPELAEALQEWQSERVAEPAPPLRININGKELQLRFLPVGVDRKQGAVIFLEDWSQVQHQARQMKLASLGRLTANIAHEIRNPLSSISHANQLLQEEDGLTTGPRRLLQIIDDNVQRMDHIVQDVLQLNRRDRARQETIALPVFLEEFRQQISDVEKIPADALVLETAAKEASCRFDRRHLQQILWNLCCNGWRYSSRQPGSLRLRLSSKGKRNNLKIEVIDDGPGVAPEFRPHLFEPFFTTESNGTGLGLYIARDLCEANGASIEYANTIEGACFSIFIKPHHG